MSSGKARTVIGAVVLTAAGMLAAGWLIPAPAAAQPEPPPWSLPSVTVPPVTVSLPPVVLPPIELSLPLPGAPGVSLPGTTIDVAEEVAPLVDPLGADVAITSPGTSTDVPSPSAPAPPPPPSAPATANAHRAADAASPAPVDEPGALPAPAPPIADDPVSARPVSQAVADTARSSAPLLAVVLLLALFAVLHARMDRDDPKLASAPVDNDVLGFR